MSFCLNCLLFVSVKNCWHSIAPGIAQSGGIHSVISLVCFGGHPHEVQADEILSRGTPCVISDTVDHAHDIFTNCCKTCRLHHVFSIFCGMFLENATPPLKPVWPRFGRPRRYWCKKGKMRLAAEAWGSPTSVHLWQRKVCILINQKQEKNFSTLKFCQGVVLECIFPAGSLFEEKCERVFFVWKTCAEKN